MHIFVNIPEIRGLLDHLLWIMSVRKWIG